MDLDRNQLKIDEMAAILDDARLKARETERLTVKCSDLSLSDAYAIQEAGVAARVSQGEKIIGLKMGLTSRAKREQMGLHQAVYGVLTDQMQVRDEVFRLAGSMHPKIEPEIAFTLGRDLSGHVTIEEAFDACNSVFAAMEILDSRFVGFKYFSLPDVIADNSSSAWFVLGKDQRSPKEIGLDALARMQMTMSINGKPAQSALSSEISGNPAQSIVDLCELLHSRGKILPAGSIVLAGAATQAVMLEAGMKVELVVEGLGAVRVEVR